jgi:hypothetical protein
MENYMMIKTTRFSKDRKNSSGELALLPIDAQSFESVFHSPLSALGDDDDDDEEEFEDYEDDFDEEEDEEDDFDDYEEDEDDFDDDDDDDLDDDDL